MTLHGWQDLKNPIANQLPEDNTTRPAWSRLHDHGLHCVAENLLAACCVPESMCDIRCGTCQRKTRVSRCLLCVWVGIRICECYNAISIVWLIAWWSLRSEGGVGGGLVGGWEGKWLSCTRTQPYRAWLIHFDGVCFALHLCVSRFLNVQNKHCVQFKPGDWSSSMGSRGIK